jgi:hypothetical protein
MGLIEWANKREKQFDIFDVGLIKLTVLFATLLIVKFWPAINVEKWRIKFYGWNETSEY